MSLKDALKRAAGMVIEFSPEETAEAPSSATSTDKMWDDLEKSVKPAGNTDDAEPADTVAPQRLPSTRTVEQIVREASGPNLDQISVTGAELPEAIGPDGAPTFAPIYTRAGLPPVAYSAEQMLEMLNSLPAELPLSTRKITVAAMLKGMGAALGASSESIVADASRKLAALAAYVESSSQQRETHIQKCRQEIASFEAQIAERRSQIDTEQTSQSRVTQVCTTEAGRLHQVLEFFSAEVQPSSGTVN